MLKKAFTLLPVINIVTNLLFFALYVIVRLDILPEDIFTFWIGTMFLSGITVLLFIISTLYQWIKNKKLPGSFSNAVSCFFSVLWLVFVGYLIYDIYNYGVF